MQNALACYGGRADFSGENPAERSVSKDMPVGGIWLSYLTAVLLGLVQGITEFLPISSSGHLALLQNIFHVEEADLLFDVLLHLGTLIAIILAYRKDLREILRGGAGLIGIGPDKGRTTSRNAGRRRMAVFLAAGTLPLLLVVPFRASVAQMMESTTLVSLMLMLTGLILYLAGRSAGGGGLERASVGKSLLVGLGQALSVVPGISRSGITISAGMLCGYSQKFAVRFSFLLSVPAVLGAAVLSLADALQSGTDLSMLPQYLCGMAAAAASGYFSIRLVRYVANKKSLSGFAYYCWGAGMIALMLSLIA